MFVNDTQLIPRSKCHLLRPFVSQKSLIKYICNNIRHRIFVYVNITFFKLEPMNTKTPNKKGNNSFLLTYILSIALFYTVLGIQGFDMCDEGWVLSGFQQIFNDPKSVQYLFLYYLSEYVGGLWYKLFDECGIFGFRLLAMLTIVGTTYIIYRMMMKYMPKWNILAGVFWAFLCAGYGIMVFYHDYFTALLAVGASYALFISLTKDKPILIALSGFIIAVNVFSRLPNLSLVSLIFVLILYYKHKHNAKKTFKMLSYAIIGFAVGSTIIFAMMSASGHLDIFLTAIQDGFSAANDKKSTHNLSDMFVTYGRNYKQVALDAILIFTVPVLTWMFRRRIPRHNAWPLFVVTGFIYVVLISFTSTNTFTLYAVSTVVCITLLIRNGVPYELKCLSLIILINMYALPLGSDGGIGNMGEYCVYMSGPFALGMFWNARGKLLTDKHAAYMVLMCTSIFMLFVLKRGLVNIASQCYFDEGYRWNKIYRINSPLATTYTTKKNCEMLDPLLRELTKYVKEDDYLLCFQNIPTVNFLTKTRPYLYNPWVWTYDPTNMEKKFDLAMKEHDRLPVIVRDKSMLPRWYEPYDDWNNDNAEETYLHKNAKIKLINRFISQHGYIVTWENDVFQILIPPKMQPVKQASMQ